MVSRSPLRADIDLDAAGRHVGHVRLPHSTHESAYGWIPVPIAVIGGGAGPSVLLTAGNHGDEYEGQIALLKLIRELDPAALRGELAWHLVQAVDDAVWHSDPDAYRDVIVSLVAQLVDDPDLPARLLHLSPTGSLAPRP